MNDTSGVGVGANDIGVSAANPASWYDDGDEPSAADVETGEEYPIEVAAAADAEGLRRERAEVEEALAGARRKLEKQRAFYEAAETEVSRLQHRIEAIDAELSSYAAPALVERDDESEV